MLSIEVVVNGFCFIYWDVLLYSGVKMYFCVISPKNVMFNYVAVFLPVQYNDRRNFLNSGPMHELTGNE